MKFTFKLLLFALALPLTSRASTIAYWRFEDGPNNGNVPATYPGTADSSGNGNTLAAFATGWAGYKYTSAVAASSMPNTNAANNYSVVNTGSYPALATQTGSLLQTWTPSAWTIEAAFNLTNGSGYRTIIGRDSKGSDTANSANSALYFQVQSDGSMAIKYCDVAGNFHVAFSGAGLINTNNWYAAAAVSDGLNLSIYLRDLTIDGIGDYQLVAQSSLSGSLNTALNAGTGDGSDWDAGNFSIGRGLYNGAHGDRAFGNIDEVRFSDTALSSSNFLFVPEPSSALLSGFGVLGLLRRRRK